jgi:hypothetical protein
MQAVYTKETAAKRSYRLVLTEGTVGWQDGGGRVLGNEPEASLHRRFLASTISLLPVESQL